METSTPLHHTAFANGCRIASGPLHEVALAVLRAQQAQPEAQALVFSDATGQPTDLDLRGDEPAVSARYASAPAPAVAAPPARSRGRPRLGVVAREVTLLPEHWEWLAAQPGGASVALRKLVHEARRGDADLGLARRRRERAYHAMSALAGDLCGFEDAARALFADDHAQLAARMSSWPRDVRAYVLQLAEAQPG